MVDMIATKKLKYGTRRLTAGDPFEARHDRDARLLIGIGKARHATRTLAAADEQVSPALPIPSDGSPLDGTRGPCIIDLPIRYKDYPPHIHAHNPNTNNRTA